jgi:hypothetical protein
MVSQPLRALAGDPFHREPREFGEQKWVPSFSNPQSSIAASIMQSFDLRTAAAKTGAPLYYVGSDYDVQHTSRDKNI